LEDLEKKNNSCAKKRNITRTHQAVSAGTPAGRTRHDEAMVDLPPSMRVPAPLTIRPSGSRPAYSSCVFCASIRNNASHLEAVLANMASTIPAVFDRIAFVVSHDHCTDRSVDILESFREQSSHEVVIIEKAHNDSPYRTHRIARARNAILECIEERFADFDFFAVFDADEVCTEPIRLDVLERYTDDAYIEAWDAITFDHVQMDDYPMRYYDLWALQFGIFVHNGMGWGKESRLVGQLMYHQLIEYLDKAPPGALLPCRSAFGGFGLYRTSKFSDAHSPGL
jgi:hypothetical protein